jgi:RecA/RadA recombinase
MKNSGKLAITISPKGVDTISFISTDRGEALNFYLSIREDLDRLDESIREKSLNKHNKRALDVN